MMSMTFQEEFGSLPRPLLTLYRRYNVSPSDHDRLIDVCTIEGILDWSLVMELVQLHSDLGYLALPAYL